MRSTSVSNDVSLGHDVFIPPWTVKRCRDSCALVVAGAATAQGRCAAKLQLLCGLLNAVSGLTTMENLGALST